MAIKHGYSRNIILADEFLADTLNEFTVVSQRAYKDKRGLLPDGIMMTLQILHDNSIYDVETDDMVMQTFDVTVLCGSHNLGFKKGDIISLHEFLPDVSYYIDFNYILRFKSAKKINTLPDIESTIQSKGK